METYREVSMNKVAVTGHQFVFFRVILGIYLVFHFAGLLPHATEIFSELGMFAAQSALPTLDALPNLFSLSDSPAFVYSVLGIGILGGVCLIMGVERRAVSLILWIVWLSLFNRNPFISNPSIAFVGFALLIMAALPNGEPFAWRKTQFDWHVPNWVSHGALLLLMLGYTVSGLHKLTAPSWVDGTALIHVLNLPLARDTALTSSLLALPTWCVNIATWGALAVEIVALPLTFYHRTRPWIWLGLFLMNVSILTVIDFADLTFGILLFHLFVFDNRWLPGRKFETAHPVVFFDGVCNLCNHAVDFLITEDQERRLKFAPIQGVAAEQISAEEVKSGESMALLDGDELYTKSDAVLMAAAGLGGIWRILSWTRVLPERLRNGVYFQVQKHRYRLFGKKDTCRLPTPEERERFLD